MYIFVEKKYFKHNIIYKSVENVKLRVLGWGLF